MPKIFKTKTKIRTILFGFSLFLFVAALLAFPSTKAVADPILTLSVPDSASGIITATVDYNFSEGPAYFSPLWVQYPSEPWLNTPPSYFNEGSGTLSYQLDTTNWIDGQIVINSYAFYVNRPGHCGVSKTITINNAPQFTVASPSGETRGITTFSIPFYTFPSTTASLGVLEIIQRYEYQPDPHAQYLGQ